MRGSTVLEAVLALVIGAGGGVGFLFLTGDLKTPAQAAKMQLEIARDAHELKAYDQEKARREELIAAAAAARVQAQQQAHAQALALQQAEAKALARAQAAAQAAEAATAEAKAAPKFGTLTVRTLSGNLDIDAGHGDHERGRSVRLAFDDRPGTIRVHAGQFDVTLLTKLGRRDLGMDVMVSPMAIISADGQSIGPTAQNLAVGRRPFRLDFHSPVGGDLNLLLTYRK